MRTSLFVADSAQVLADGKLMAVGMYTDRVLQVGADDRIDPTPEVPFGLPTLSLVLTIMDLLPGEYEVQLGLKDATGKDYPATLPVRPFNVQAGGSANIVLNFAPFVIFTFGRHELVASVAGKTARESFEVRRVAAASIPGQISRQLSALRTPRKSAKPPAKQPKK